MTRGKEFVIRCVLSALIGILLGRSDLIHDNTIGAHGGLIGTVLLITVICVVSWVFQEFLDLVSKLVRRND